MPEQVVTTAREPPATPPSTVFVMTTGAVELCEDRDGMCEFWAGLDECITNPGWMLVNCRLSCNACDFLSRTTDHGVTGPPVTAPDTTTTTIETEIQTGPTVPSTGGEQSATPMPEQVITTVTEPPATPPSTVFVMTTGAVELCEDRDDMCEFWAGLDECISNPGWMLVNCRLSCNACDYLSRTTDHGVTGPPVTAPDTTTTTIETEIQTGPPGTVTPPNCEDTDILCGYWAANGECQNNPEWMPQNCPVSCNTCDLRTTVQDGQGTTGRPATRPIDDTITTVSTSTTTAPSTTTTSTTASTAMATTEREKVDDGSGDVDATTMFGPFTPVRSAGLALLEQLCCLSRSAMAVINQIT